MDDIPSREKLLTTLRGRSFVIPDLQQIFGHWPQDVHPELGRLAEDVKQRLDYYFPQGAMRRKMDQADVAFFAASWWPYAPFERLCIATYLALWLFAWDDETDSAEVSTLIRSSQRAHAFRQETKSFIHQYLSPGTKQDKTQSPHPVIGNFETVGRAIFRSCTSSQTNIFLQELDYFVDMTALEHRIQMSDHLPSVDEYMQRRMGSSAVGVCLAISEYVLGIEIPQSAMQGEDIRRLWKLTNIIISTSNDIISVKKELDQGQVDTLIPLLFLEHGSLQLAVDRAVHMVRSSVAEFDILSKQLLDQHSNNEVHENLLNFVKGCKYACTANINWSVSSGRYGLASQLLRGQKLTL